MGMEGIGLPGDQVIRGRGDDRRSAGPGALWIAGTAQQYHECFAGYWGTYNWRTVHRHYAGIADCRPEAARSCAFPRNQAKSYLLARLGWLYPGYLWSD